MTIELLIEVANPRALDLTLQSLGAALVQDPNEADGYQTAEGGTAYVARVLGDPGFVRFAVERQGYGRVVGERKVSEGSSS